MRHAWNSNMTALWSAGKRALTSALFPAKCLACGCFYDSRGYEAAAGEASPVPGTGPSLRSQASSLVEWIASSVCPTCCGDYQPIETPICMQCGTMFRSRNGEDHTCEDCARLPKRFGVARASGVYAGSFMEMIHAFKYRGRIQLAKPLGRLLLATLLQYWTQEAIDLILPVPLHRKRLKERGFNQAFLLISNWSDLAVSLGSGVFSVPIDPLVLTRHRPTRPQTGLGRRERMANIGNAFSVRDADRIAGKRILVVDDVYTTGATVNECADVLLRRGAQRVDVLTLARAM